MISPPPASRPPMPALSEMVCPQCDRLRSSPNYHEDEVEQLMFELSWELEEASLNSNDYVTVNREKLRAIAHRVLGRLTAARAGGEG